MVKLCASLLSLTLTTSLALAAPHPSYTHGLDLDEEFSRREYLPDASDDLAARDPNIFGDIGRGFQHAVKDVGRVAGDVGRVAVKGLHVAEDIAQNPIVQAAASVIPGGGAIMAAEKVVSTLGKIKNFENDASRFAGALGKGREIVRKANEGGRLGRALRKAENIGNSMRRVNHQIASPRRTTTRSTTHRRHRRDLEDNEELSRREFDDEELVGREYDDFLAERDFFDDLD